MELAFAIVLLGLLFDYTNGFHDAANVVSTVIATRVLLPLSAIVLASCLNLIGATQVSGVAQTIATGLVDAQETSQTLVLSALIGAIAWNFLTWYFGLPSSSSYALIGSLLGASLATNGPESILWKGVSYQVFLPMLLSPFIGFFLSLSFMRFLQRPSFSSKNRLFAHLQIGSASLVALAHGMNDAQKSMGIITLGLFASQLIPSTEIPFWVIASCALVMALGTATGGFRIIKTVGFSITKLSPTQGFAAESSASMVILIASFLGMPISSSHLIAGSVTGVGAARGVSEVRWRTLKKIGIAWLLTLPGSALIGAISSLLF
jgi:PiT family inorganic phosphate transporter